MLYRVVILENRNIIKEGLYRILHQIGSDIEILDYNDIQSLTDQNIGDIDIILIDYALLFSEPKVIRHLKRHHPNTHFIGITNYICERMTSDLIDDMIYLNDNSERIESMFKNLIQSSKQYVDLSEREEEILKLLATGSNTKSIAESLYISPHTVATHKKNILKKTHKNSVIELVSYAYECGILSPKHNI